MRGVVSGLIWGGVVSVFGLGVVSQLAPVPGAEKAANDIVAPEVERTAEPVKAPEAVVQEPGVPEAGSTEAGLTEPGASEPEAMGAGRAGAEPAVTSGAAGAEAGPVTPSEVTPSAEGAAPEATAPAVDVAGADAPEVAATGAAATGTPASEVPASVTPEAVTPSADASDAAAMEPSAAPLPGEVPAHSPLAPEVGGEPETGAMLEPLAPAEPLLDAPEAKVEAPVDAPEAGVPDVALVVPAEPMVPGAVVPEAVVPEAKPEAVVPEAVTPEPVTPEPVTPEPVAPLAPAASLPEAVEGVTTNRLPRIEAAEDAAPAAEAAPEAEMAAQAADTRPVARFAARFDNAAGKPLYAILLLDDGAADLDRAALAALPLPLTIVLDPASPEAGKLAAEYRKAGKEVAMLATAIPKGATPSDLQVSFEAHAKALPEAVAVVDLPSEGFQNNRKLAADLLPVIKDQGRGLVTFDKGLNAGDQVARREGVPAALIFRELDAEGEAAPLIRRYLDRAAFKAVQDGRVTVLGRARPETIAALLEWSVEGRAGSVALAPLTAVLSVPE